MKQSPSLSHQRSDQHLLAVSKGTVMEFGMLCAENHIDNSQLFCVESLQCIRFCFSSHAQGCRMKLSDLAYSNKSLKLSRDSTARFAGRCLLDRRSNRTLVQSDGLSSQTSYLCLT
eukprot:168151-Amphidinium_carterae.1